MKKNLLMFSFLVGSIAAWGQKTLQMQPADPSGLKFKSSTEGIQPKTVSCSDTIRYPQAKEQLLGTGTYYLFDMEQAFQDRFSQTFLLSGSSMNISGVEIYGKNGYDATTTPVTGTSSVTVKASIYSVDAAYTPTTLLGSGTVTFSATTNAYRYINFATPVTVTGNYSIVIEVENTGGVYTTYITNQALTPSYDEALTRVSSMGFAASAGNFISIPSLTSNLYDFEPLVAPIISYVMTATATAAPDPSCLGTAVAFTGSVSPAEVLNNRMYNFNVFSDHFNLATSDSTYAWDMTPLAPTATVVWNASHNYTYPTIGTHSADFYAMGGFWRGCADVATTSITVNSVPTVNAGSDVTICSGTSTTLDADGAVSYSWDNGVGAGETHSVTPTATTTYTVTGTGANGCTNTDQVVVTVTPLDNATFAYTSNTICESSANVTPTVALPGTFSSTAGLVIDPTTGEIDVASSSIGTYTVTHSVNAVCANTASQAITITTAPEAGFSYASTDYCAGSANASPVFDAGASAGTFTSTGLSINSATGEINIAASMPGEYTVTNTIAASGSCPAAAASTTVSIFAQPTAVVTGGGNICGTGTSTVTIALTGEAPYDFTYTDGTTPVTVTAHAGATYTINATAAGTYTVTSVSDANCSNVGTGSAQVNVFSNPTVSMAALPTVCSNGTPVALTQGTPAGGTYTGTGVTGSTFTPSVAGPAAITYNYTDANGCSGSASGTITVEAAPTVALTALADVCSDVAPFALAGGSPAGGTYSGPGVTAGNFNPATAGVGTHTIVYTYTNTTGALCSSTASSTIVVKNCAGLEDNELETSFAVYPNPTHETVTVSFQTTEALAVTVNMISLDGKVVFAQQVPQTNQFSQEIAVADFPAGIYLIQLQTANGSATRRLIVQ